MQLANLEKTIQTRPAKRLGRGESSGKGKTAGKGYKGQNVRGKVRLGFEGGQLPIIKRLPFRRGIGNNLSQSKLTITLDQLKVFESGDTVNLKTLLEKGLLEKTFHPKTVKVVNKGEVTKALKIDLKITKKAAAAIEKAKGEVLNKKSEGENA